jgi:long-chain acyl-CoA synthetase
MENPTPNSLVEFLRLHAARSPHQNAIFYFDTAISYQALDEQSDALASALVGLGFHAHDRLALFLQNEPAMVVATFAVWKLGGVAVPLNIMLKEHELDYHLGDSQVAGVICSENDADLVGEVARRRGLRFLITVSPYDYLDPGRPLPEVVAPPASRQSEGALAMRSLLEKHRGRRPEAPPGPPEEIAYLHYTSGTTGPSKGAMVAHSSVLFNAASYEQGCGLGREDCILAIAPLFHITGAIGHLATACHLGVPMVLLHRFHPAEAIRQTFARKATFTIGALTALVAMLDRPDFDARKLATLTKVFSGGAPVLPAVVERWEKATGAYIHNVWGMTETTSPGTITPLGVRAPVDPETGALAIGLPVPQTEVRIVDPASGERLPPGQVGELVVRGPHIFRGYWNKPDETSHAWRDGWLYTGDFAKVDREGWVYWIERKKDLIITSGYKVWPREVEGVLLEHPGISEVAVIGAPDPYRGEAVSAAVVLKPEWRGKIEEDELIAFSRSRLANYKCPRRVEILDELPKSPQGKILRKVLREMAGVQQEEPRS